MLDGWALIKISFSCRNAPYIGAGTKNFQKNNTYLNTYYIWHQIRHIPVNYLFLGKFFFEF
jgi:hypothetical protein